MTSDPIGLNGGLNTFGYVGGNPLKYIDRKGMLYSLYDVFLDSEYEMVLDDFNKSIYDAENAGYYDQFVKCIVIRSVFPGFLGLAGGGLERLLSNDYTRNLIAREYHISI